METQRNIALLPSFPPSLSPSLPLFEPDPLLPIKRVILCRCWGGGDRYVDQGGGKRPGAFAVYIEPWHADVFEVLELKKNHGKDELRAR